MPSLSAIPCSHTSVGAYAASGRGHAVRAEDRLGPFHYQPRTLGADRGGRGDDIDLPGLLIPQQRGEIVQGGVAGTRHRRDRRCSSSHGSCPSAEGIWPSGRQRASRWPVSKAPSRARARNRPSRAGKMFSPRAPRQEQRRRSRHHRPHATTTHACAKRHHRCPRSREKILPARSERSERLVAGPARRRTLTSPGVPRPDWRRYPNGQASRTQRL